jgi:hypothetical protein
MSNGYSHFEITPVYINELSITFVNNSDLKFKMDWIATDLILDVYKKQLNLNQNIQHNKR